MRCKRDEFGFNVIELAVPGDILKYGDAAVAVGLLHERGDDEHYRQKRSINADDAGMRLRMLMEALPMLQASLHGVMVNRKHPLMRPQRQRSDGAFPF